MVDVDGKIAKELRRFLIRQEALEKYELHRAVEDAVSHVGCKENLIDGAFMWWSSEYWPTVDNAWKHHLKNKELPKILYNKE